MRRFAHRYSTRGFASGTGRAREGALVSAAPRADPEGRSTGNEVYSALW